MAPGSAPLDGRSAWRGHALDLLERTDPAGHAIHLVAAVVALLAAPLGTAPGNIAFVVLLAVWCLRLPRMGAALAGLGTWPPLILGALFVAWCGVTLLWSPRPDQGAHLLLSMRALALPCLLWPVIRSWRVLAAALLLGASVQAGVQVGQFLVNRMAWNYDGLARFGGFSADPGKAGLWDGIAACLAAGLAVSLKGRARWLALAVVVLAGGGLAASVTRRHLLAALAAAPVFIAAAAWWHPRLRKPLAVGGLTALAGGALLLTLTWGSLATRLSQTREQLTSLAEKGGVLHHDLRFYYWRAALHAWWQDPVTGYGLGGTRPATAGYPERERFESLLQDSPIPITPEMWAPDHPHSTWVQVLAETGLVGLGLAAAAVAAVLRTTAARARVSPLQCGTLAAMIFWCVAALFDSSMNASTLTAISVLAALGALPPADDARDPRSTLLWGFNR
ncbi:MAG: O-antigen ligase family protein [Phycisphaerales bacterium]